MSYVQPCAKPENNPDDWYIKADGRQYSDDVLVTDEEIEAFVEACHGVGATMDPIAARERLEADARRAALIRRRKAKDLCHTDCVFRLHCLDLALKNNETHGTWGGYTEEELAKIRAAKRERFRKLPLIDTP